MGLRFILGNVCTGKTKFSILEAVKNQSQKKKSIFIVPEQSSLNIEKEILETTENGIMIDLQVFSFTRLSYRVFMETGAPKEKNLDGIGKAMLIRKIIFENKKELLFYTKVSDQNGFLEDMNVLLKEFYAYGITVKNLEEFLKTDPSALENNIKLKMQDIALILSQYQDFLKDNYVTEDETLSLLADKISLSEELKEMEIYIDGFTGFTQQELQVILKLMQVAKRVNISLTINENNIYFNNIEENENFYTTKKTLNTLYKLAVDNSVLVEEPIFLGENAKIANVEINHLLNNYFASYKKPFTYKTEKIFLNIENNKYEEVMAVANDILYMVKKENYRFKDIAIITGDINAYYLPLIGALQNYGIPYFVDKKVNITTHSFIDFVRCIPMVFISNWSYESVFRTLKLGFSPLGQEEIYILENYVLEYGIKGTMWQYESWNFGKKNSNYDLEEINNYKNIVVAFFNIFSNNMNLKKENNTQLYLTNLSNVLKTEWVQTKLKTMIIESFEAKDFNNYSKNKQVWDKIKEVLEKINDIFGETELTLKAFNEILDSGINYIDLGLIPTSLDQILIGDMSRTKLFKTKVVFFIGMNDGLVPKTNKESGILTESDRIVLEQNQIKLAPDGNSSFLEAILNIYILFSKVEERMYFSYSSGSLDGKQILPSVIIKKIRKIFPDISQYTHENYISTKKVMFNNLGTEYKNGNSFLKDFNAEMVRYFMQDEEYSKKMESLLAITEEKSQKVNLPNVVVNKLYGREIVCSASKLEAYVKCPYAYFLRYNLDVKERKLNKIENYDFGNLYHYVLEEFSKVMETKKISWGDITKETAESLLKEIIEKEAPKINNEILLSNKRYQFFLKKVEKTVYKSVWALSQHYKNGSFKSLGSEIKIGENSLFRSIVVDIGNDRKIYINGRIDRVDVMDSEGNKYIKIIDYKSGNNKFSMEDLFFGSQLQLFLYMDMILSNKDKFGEFEGEVLPGGIFYFRIKNPILKDEAVGNEENLEKSILKEFKMSGLVIGEEAVVHGLDNNIDGISQIVPVRLDKEGHILPKSSEVINLEEYENTREIVFGKVKEIGNDITSGAINIEPVKNGKATNCDYCLFSGICKKDYFGDELKYKRKN